jgi:hypothetical protein
MIINFCTTSDVATDRRYTKRHGGETWSLTLRRVEAVKESENNTQKTPFSSILFSGCCFLLSFTAGLCKHEGIEEIQNREGIGLQRRHNRRTDCIGVYISSDNQGKQSPSNEANSKF